MQSQLLCHAVARDDDEEDGGHNFIMEKERRRHTYPGIRRGKNIPILSSFSCCTSLPPERKMSMSRFVDCVCFASHAQRLTSGCESWVSGRSSFSGTQIRFFWDGDLYLLLLYFSLPQQRIISTDGMAFHALFSPARGKIEDATREPLPLHPSCPAHMRSFRRLSSPDDVIFFSCIS